MERLQKLRDEAQQKAIVAKKELEQVEQQAKAASKAAELPAYSSKEYWAERYQGDSDGEASSSSSSSTYEWYASFSALEGLIKASIQRCSDRSSPAILLPGCGNSDLGEKMASAFPGKCCMSPAKCSSCLPGPLTHCLPCFSVYKIVY